MSDYTDLKPGDRVVHVDFGVGRYISLVRRVLDGAEREFLAVEYEGGDQIFVPVYQADRLSRYIGPGGEPPTPTRRAAMNGRRLKQRVRESVQQVAQELLELYVCCRWWLDMPLAWMPSGSRTWKPTFPYVETEDQLRAIGEVKKDMENTRPMDRLMCGDVGYGKTEVGLRAAFKAVMDGKQVAIRCQLPCLRSSTMTPFANVYPPFRWNGTAFRFRTQQQQDIIKQLVEARCGQYCHRHTPPDPRGRYL